jgi:hypothetical protein
MKAKPMLRMRPARLLFAIPALVLAALLALLLTHPASGIVW